MPDTKPSYVTSAELQAFEDRISKKITDALATHERDIERHRSDTEARLGPIFARLSIVEQKAVVVETRQEGDMKTLRESIDNMTRRFETMASQLLDMFQRNTAAVERMDARLDESDKAQTKTEGQVKELRREVFGEPGHNRSLTAHIDDKFDTVLQNQVKSRDKMDSLGIQMQIMRNEVAERLEDVEGKAEVTVQTVYQLQAGRDRWKLRLKAGYAALEKALASRPGVLLIIRLGGVILALVLAALGIDGLGLE